MSQLKIGMEIVAEVVKISGLFSRYEILDEFRNAEIELAQNTIGKACCQVGAVRLPPFVRAALKRQNEIARVK